MKEIIHQYGRMLCMLAVTILLLAMLFYGNRDGGLVQKIADGLVQDVPVEANAAEIASREEFLKETVNVCAKSGLAAGEKYKVGEILVASDGEASALSGGKVLSVHRLYDGKNGVEESENISDEAIVSDGKKVAFPNRGLYRLCVSVRDGEARETLQYVFVSIEGEL